MPATLSRMDDTLIVTLGFVAAFLGGAVGSLFPLAFARSHAIDKATGEHYAMNRIALIEKLSGVVGESLDHMDLENEIPPVGDLREFREVAGAFLELERHAKLYLSENLCKSLRPFTTWLWNRAQGQDSTQPTRDAVKNLETMLAEAIEGKHTRIPR